MPTTEITTTQPTLALGDQYLQNSYPFTNQSNKFTEQIRIADPSWAIAYTIQPLSENLQNCWFEMTVTNLDLRKTRLLTGHILMRHTSNIPCIRRGLTRSR